MHITMIPLHLFVPAVLFEKVQQIMHVSSQPHVSYCKVPKQESQRKICYTARETIIINLMLFNKGMCVYVLSGTTLSEQQFINDKFPLYLFF